MDWRNKIIIRNPTNRKQWKPHMWTYMKKFQYNLFIHNWILSHLNPIIFVLINNKPITFHKRKDIILHKYIKLQTRLSYSSKHYRVNNLIYKRPVMYYTYNISTRLLTKTTTMNALWKSPYIHWRRVQIPEEALLKPSIAN